VRQHLGAVLPLPSLLARVVADHVPSPPFAVADLDRLDLEVVGDSAVAPWPPQDLVGDLVAAPHGHADDEATAARAQGVQIGLRDHAGITDEHAATEPPAAQVALDLLDRRDVHRIAGEHPVAHRHAVPGHGQPHDDLRRVAAAVLGVSSLARGTIRLAARRAAAVDDAVGVAAVLLLDLEVQRGRVVEDEVHVQVEQVADAEEDRLLDGLLVGLQEVHRTVVVVQFQVLDPCDTDVLTQPLLVAVQLGARRAGTVGDHGEKRSLSSKADVGQSEALLDHGANAEMRPQVL
jgi:hypothetical protein